jgi:phage-related protein
MWKNIWIHFQINNWRRCSLFFNWLNHYKIVPKKFFKKLESTDDLWEVRVQLGNNIFRFLGFFDGAQLVILNHVFTKKTQKTSQKEIKIAEQRKKDYFSRRLKP